MLILATDFFIVDSYRHNADGLTVCTQEEVPLCWLMPPPSLLALVPSADEVPSDPGEEPIIYVTTAAGALGKVFDLALTG